jgi:5-formyltetrahydrofolate cyclo-ligase
LIEVLSLTNRAENVGVIAAKADLRSAMIAGRERIPASERQAGARKLAEIGLGFAEPPRGWPVSGYAAFGAELDPFPLLEALARHGHSLCLPVIQPRGSPLTFRSWGPGQSLIERQWGIREPGPDAVEVVPMVLLIPLLAFDRAGWRLGYGGGYYDRTLAGLRARSPVVAIGVGFDEQRVCSVPHGDNDERLDWVLTPSGPVQLG